jgi:SHAQKYF class myb-like DNA-binding protein
LKPNFSVSDPNLQSAHENFSATDVYDNNEIEGCDFKENTGRWTQEEHELFIQGLKIYHKQWKLIAELIKTRTVVQIRTHAQKYFQKLTKNKSGVMGEMPLEVFSYSLFQYDVLISLWFL